MWAAESGVWWRTPLLDKPYYPFVIHKYHTQFRTKLDDTADLAYLGSALENVRTTFLLITYFRFSTSDLAVSVFIIRGIAL
jgi:hypothetical protein